MTRSPQKRALLIGIDKYEAMRDLDGCANDIELMRGILIERFGFPTENITVLLDERATAPAIVSAWEDLIEGTGEGDIVVTHYAGHGSQLPDLEDDQPDGFDETIVTHESHHRGDKPNTDITNDQINDWLVGLSQKKPGNITVIFDCCHSGTMTRDASGGKARQARGDTRPPSVMSREPFQPKWAKAPTGGQDFGASRWLPLSDAYVLIAGCRDEELSYEKAVKHGEKRVAHGSLTYHLCEELRKATSGFTYRDVFEPTRAAVTAHDSRQHPQIEGAQDKAIFGVETITPMRYIEVSSRDGDTVELDGGMIHGVAVGSKWAVYPPGAKATDAGPKLGFLEISDVRPATATARVIDGTEEAASPIVSGGRAVLEEYSFGDLVLTYTLMVDEELSAAYAKQVSGLEQALAAEGLVREAKADEPADARIYLIGPREEADPGDPAPQLGGLAEPTWAVVTADGELMMPPKGVDGWEWSEGRKTWSIASNLRILAGLRHAMTLDNPVPDNPLRGKVKLHLWRRDAAGEWHRAEPEEDGRLVFKSAYRDADGKVHGKEHIGFSVELDADYPDPLYLNLIALDPAGVIDVIYPPGEAHEKLEPGREFKIRMDTRPGEKPMFFGLPANYPFYRDPLASGPIEGPQTFKLFVSTVPLNLRFIEQSESVRSAEGSEQPDSKLQALVRGALGSRAGFEDDGEEGDATLPAEVQGWATVTRSVTLRREPATGDARLTGTAGEVTLGEVAINAPNIVGAASIERRESGSRSAVPEAQTNELTKALWSSGLKRRAAIRIDGKSRPADTERGTGGPTPATIRVPDPGPDLGQAVLSTDDSGLLRWHFEAPERATRGAAERGPRTYELDDLDLGIEDPTDRARGIPTALVKKVVEVVVFPLLDPIGARVTEAFAGEFEKRRRPYRVRRFTPDDYGVLEAAEMDESAWGELAAGPSLLMLHGPFTRTHGAFGSLPREYVEDLYRKYEGRVFAFDHFTMSHDPADNVKELLARVPDGVSLKDIDVICHSRGGLVARVLAEQQGDSPKLGVRRAVFVGSPNAGTALASPKHMSDFINHYTNMFGVLGKVISVVDQSGIVDGIESVLTAVKQLAAGGLKGLDGINCMAPDSAFIQGLNKGSVSGDRYFALASNFDPERADTVRLLMGKLAVRVFGGSQNDLVVPSRSVVDRRRLDAGAPGGTERRKGNGDSAWFSQQLVLEPGSSEEAIAHDSYFASAEGRRIILEDWLSD